MLIKNDILNNFGMSFGVRLANIVFYSIIFVGFEKEEEEY